MITVRTTSTSSTTATDTGNTTGGLPTCAPLPDPAACEAEPGCYWFTDLGECIVDCSKIKDQATCQMQAYCSWFDETCELVLA